MLITPNKNGLADNKALKEEKNKAKTEASEKSEERFDSKEKREVVNYQSYPAVKALGCLSMFLGVMILCGMVAVVFWSEPMVKKEPAFPNDFPSDINVYLPNQAIIKTQNQEQRERFLRMSNSLPNWFLTPFLGKISTDYKTQILLDSKSTPKFDAIAMKRSIDGLEPGVKTISLVWPKVPKTRNDLSRYYQEKLKASGYGIDLSESGSSTSLLFFKDNNRGIIRISDSFSSSGSAKVVMTLIYLP